MFFSLMQKMRSFMSGRYGVDALSRFLMISYLVLSFGLGIVSRFVHFEAVPIWWTLLVNLPFLIFAWAAFRMISKNIPARSRENDAFIRLRGKLRIWGGQAKDAARRDRVADTHRIYSCPGCGQKVRVPTGKGKVSITCPRCKKEFTKRT